MKPATAKTDASRLWIMGLLFMSSKTKRAPIDCNFDQLCKLDRDNKEFGDFWVTVDGHEVTIAEQATGESLKQSISVPIPVFKKIQRFLTTPRKQVR